MFDAHAHLAYENLNPTKQIENAKRVGVDGIIVSAYPRDLDASMKIAEKNKDYVYLTFGLHPIDIADLSDKEINDYIEFIKRNKNKAIGIGEIGLDYHHFEKDSEENKRFRFVFERLLELAKELNLPVVLHTRKAEQECFDIIVKHRIKKAVFHCYSGNLTLARKIINQGYYISLATNLLRSKNTKKIAKNFPLNRLLTETDSPFLSPIPGKKNEPANVKFVLENIAKLRGIDLEEVDKQTTQNVGDFFYI